MFFATTAMFGLVVLHHYNSVWFVGVDVAHDVEEVRNDFYFDIVVVTRLIATREDEGAGGGFSLAEQVALGYVAVSIILQSASVIDIVGDGDWQLDLGVARLREHIEAGNRSEEWFAAIHLIADQCVTEHVAF